jgi:hypothetical protein
MKTTISELFDVSYGQRGFENKQTLSEGNTILISSSGRDNGCIGFFDIEPFYKKPFITIPRTGSVGEAFVQTYECCVNDNVIVLVPKKKIEIENLFQIAYQIRLNKWRYTFYGRTVTPEKIKKQVITLENIDTDYKKLLENILPKEKSKININENSKFKVFKVIDLCSVEKKNSLPKNLMNSDGKTPYVTTTSFDNGVSEFVDEKPIFKGKCLSVSLNGSVGEVFFQIEDFITSGDNAILRLKTKYNPYLLIYIGVLIRNNQWRYNYYRKMSINKLKNLELPMPMKDKDIDIDYIKKIIQNSYGFEQTIELL